MLDTGTYLLYRAGSALVSAFPLALLFSLGEFLGLIAWILSPRYRHLAQRNLAIAFAPEKSPAELLRLTRRHFQRLGANLLCSAKLGTMPVEEVTKCVTLENADLLHEQLRAGRGVVLALSHFGSWELFAQVFMHHFGYARISTVFQPLGNRGIDADVRRKRSRFGVELFDRREGFQKAIELLRGGGVVGILCDQHAGDQGLWTPFFGRLASTTPLPGLLAKRTNAAVIASAAFTSGRGHWRLTFAPAFNGQRDSVETITAKANREIANLIQSAPEDWFWVHNRWKTPRPNWLLQKYKRGLFLPETIGAKGLQPFRIVIRASNWLGDSVISMPAVRAIKRGRPDAHVTILAPEKIAAVWRLLPEVDEVLSLGSKSLRKAVGLLRAQPAFDAGIVFPNSLRVALELWLARIPRRVGYAGHCRSWLLNQVVRKLERRGPPPHQAEHYLDIARSLGVDAEVGEIAISAPPSARPSERKIGLCPGADYGPAKRWLPERFAATAAAIGGKWILFGTARDKEAGAEIAAALGENCVNLIGKTSLEQLIEELRQCQLLLTNDTGTMHLATLLGVPVVAVFGSTEPGLTGPLGSAHAVVRHQVECSPCFLRECPLDFRCMQAVSVEEVTALVAGRLSGS